MNPMIPKDHVLLTLEYRETDSVRSVSALLNQSQMTSEQRNYDITHSAEVLSYRLVYATEGEI